MTPNIDLDDQGRPRWLFERTVHEGCDRAGLAELGDFAERPGDGHGCLVKIGCRGPVVKCNVPVRGWVNGIGGCPNVGGICMACTSPGFPDKFMPFMEAGPAREAVGPHLALHLRAGDQVLPRAPHAEPLRGRARVAAADARAGERLRAALVRRRS